MGMEWIAPNWLSNGKWIGVSLQRQYDLFHPGRRWCRKCNRANDGDKYYGASVYHGSFFCHSWEIDFFRKAVPGATRIMPKNIIKWPLKLIQGPLLITINGYCFLYAAYSTSHFHGTSINAHGKPIHFGW